MPADLENQKLAVEIEELKLKIDAEKRRLQLQSRTETTVVLTAWTKVLIAAGTILVTGLTIGTQVYGFFEQDNRQYQVQIGQQMVQLVDKLDEGDANAIVLLSYFESDAIPILLMNLGRVDDSTPTIEALRSVERRLDNDAVITELLANAREELDRFFAAPANEARRLAAINNLLALGELGTSRREDVLILLDDTAARVATIPDQLAATRTVMRRAIATPKAELEHVPR